MSVFESVKAKNIELRKARSPLASVLGSVVNMAQLAAKDRALKAKAEITVTDEDAIQALRKTIKQCDDMLSLAPESSDQFSQATAEKAMLSELLPQETSLQDLKESIVMFMADKDDYSMKNMGPIMAHLTGKFGTALNKAVASQEVKRYLSAMAE